MLEIAEITKGFHFLLFPHLIFIPNLLPNFIVEVLLYVIIFTTKINSEVKLFVNIWNQLQYRDFPPKKLNSFTLKSIFRMSLSHPFSMILLVLLNLENIQFKFFTTLQKCQFKRFIYCQAMPTNHGLSVQCRRSYSNFSNYGSEKVFEDPVINKFKDWYL